MNSPGSALLIVDVQQDLFEKTNPVYQAEQLLDNIQALVMASHRAGVRAWAESILSDTRALEQLYE